MIPPMDENTATENNKGENNLAGSRDKTLPFYGGDEDEVVEDDDDGDGGDVDEDE